MSYYATEADIEAVTGFSIDTNSVPTSTGLAILQGMADSKINGVFKGTENITDSNGILKAIEIDIVYKYINNIFAMKNPNSYGYIPPELTEQQIHDILYVYRIWTARSYHVGEE